MQDVKGQRSFGRPGLLVLGVRALIRVCPETCDPAPSFGGAWQQDGRAVSQSARVLSAKQSGHSSCPSITSEAWPARRRNEASRVKISPNLVPLFLSLNDLFAATQL